MKIIHVIGHSGSGKTTFIAGLIEQLTPFGRVATVKHLGHHRFEMAEGKDTTVFFEHGAVISAGVDDEKSVLALETTNLEDILDIYLGYGIDFVVIEGFKETRIRGIVMGDLKCEDLLFRNPTHEEVMKGIWMFPEYSRGLLI